MSDLGKNLIDNLLEKTKTIDLGDKTVCVLTDNISIFYDIDGGLFLLDQHKNCVSIGLENKALYNPLHLSCKSIIDGCVIKITTKDYLEFQEKLIEDDEDDSIWTEQSATNDEQFYILYDTTADVCVTIAKGLNNRIISKSTIDKYMIWQVTLRL